MLLLLYVLLLRDATELLLVPVRDTPARLRDAELLRERYPKLERPVRKVVPGIVLDEYPLRDRLKATPLLKPRP